MSCGWLLNWSHVIRISYYLEESHLTDVFKYQYHYNDVIMGAMASQITSLTIVYSTVHSGADQRKHQSSASLAFVRGIHRWPVNSPHKWPVTRKIFPFDDVIICEDPAGICFCYFCFVYICSTYSATNIKGQPILLTHLPLVPLICVSESALVQIMVCRLFGAKRLSKPMLGYFHLDHQEQISVKYTSKYNIFHL